MIRSVKECAPHRHRGAHKNRILAGRAGRRPIQKGTRVLISLWDSLMFGRVPQNAAGFGLDGPAVDHVDGGARDGAGAGAGRGARAAGRPAQAGVPPPPPRRPAGRAAAECGNRHGTARTRGAACACAIAKNTQTLIESKDGTDSIACKAAAGRQAGRRAGGRARRAGGRAGGQQHRRTAWAWAWGAQGRGSWPPGVPAGQDHCRVVWHGRGMAWAWACGGWWQWYSPGRHLHHLHRGPLRGALASSRGRRTVRGVLGARDRLAGVGAVHRCT